MHDTNHPGAIPIKNSVLEIDRVEIVPALISMVANDNLARRYEIKPIARLACAVLAGL